MAFHADSGRIYITNGSGDVVFDTVEKLFTATDYVAGSVSFGPYVAQNQNAVEIGSDDIEIDHVLSSVNSAANCVRGAFFVTTTSGSQGLHNIGWFNASGTYLHHIQPVGPVGVVAGSSAIRSMVGYTFFATGGSLKVKERVVHRSQISLTSTTFTSTILAVNLQYKLFAGTFV